MEEKDLYKGLSVAMVSLVAGLINMFLGIAIMIKGWGVEATSWGWIIVGGLFVLMITSGLAGILKAMYGGMEK